MVPGTSPVASLFAEKRNCNPQRCSSKHTTTCPTGKGVGRHGLDRGALIPPRRAQPGRLGCADTTVPHSMSPPPPPTRWMRLPRPSRSSARHGGVAPHREARLQSSKRHDAAQTYDNMPAGRGRRSPWSRPRRARLSRKRAQPRRLGCGDTTVPHTALFRRPHPPAGCDCPNPHGHQHVMAALLQTGKHDCKVQSDTMQGKHTTTCPRAEVVGCHGLGRGARIVLRTHVSLRQLELSWGAAFFFPVPLPVLHRPLVRLLLPILPHHPLH